MEMWCTTCRSSACRTIQVSWKQIAGQSFNQSLLYSYITFVWTCRRHQHIPCVLLPHPAPDQVWVTVCFTLAGLCDPWAELQNKKQEVSQHMAHLRLHSDLQYSFIWSITIVHVIAVAFEMVLFLKITHISDHLMYNTFPPPVYISIHCPSILQNGFL